jgi:hypothetical protein
MKNNIKTLETATVHAYIKYIAVEITLDLNALSDG